MAAEHSSTFFDIVTCSGAVGILMWLGVFAMGPVGFILGIVSTVMSCKADVNRYPFSFKLLVGFLVCGLLIGGCGVIYGIGVAEIGLATTGAEKAMLLAYAISSSLYMLAFTLLEAIPYTIFIAVSVIIIHFRQKKLYPSQVDGEGNWVVE